MKVRRKHILNLVNEILATNNIQTAPVNINKIAKNLDIQIIKQSTDDKIAGFLIKGFADKNALIGVNEKHHPNRQRFTIAHEIGHYFLHHYEGVHFDSHNTGLQVYLRDDLSSEGTSAEEREANLFAAELLMPRSILISDVVKFSEYYLLEDRDTSIQKLAHKYKVSAAALTYRLVNLGFIEL
jgi:Zn-dependent peptidase ImmA (M78 family)